ncbi:MAG: glutaredoxin family protein, partial [Myxococcales bacterium]|nr:glutaredoxin family protein [Myxococcales bacterium]
KGDLRGLHLVWFDGDGVHTAKRRSDIPESARGRVRVESLSVESPDRLGPDRVYVADVRNPLANGSYPMHIERRATFDAWADHAQGRAEEARSFRFAGGDAPAKRTAATTAFGDPVIMYRTSWCGVCKKADKYFRERGVEVVEKDVERDPAAAREMSAKVSAHGLKPGAVPVIDIDGEVMQGFSRPRLDAILTRRLKSI